MALKTRNGFYKSRISALPDRSKKTTAFTLAEVLITLGIIGIVASLTIPTLINNYQKHQYVVGLKRALAVWNQALTQMAADAGCPDDLGCFFDSKDANVMGEKMSKYFKTIKTCKIYDNSCAPKHSINLNGKPLSYPNGYRIVTADGMTTTIPETIYSCNNNSYYAHGPIINGRGTWGACVCAFYVTVDVNGDKAPNINGRDTFVFNIVNKRGRMFEPSNASSFNLATLKTMCDVSVDKGVGWGDPSNFCAARIMMEDWEMNY